MNTNEFYVRKDWLRSAGIRERGRVVVFVMMSIIIITRVQQRVGRRLNNIVPRYMFNTGASWRRRRRSHTGV